MGGPLASGVARFPRQNTGDPQKHAKDACSGVLKSGPFPGANFDALTFTVDTNNVGKCGDLRSLIY